MVLEHKFEVLFSDNFHIDVLALLDVFELEYVEMVKNLALSDDWQMSYIVDEVFAVLLLTTLLVFVGAQ